MSKRAKPALIAAGAFLAVLLLIAAFLSREPRYQGLTMGEWLKSPDRAKANEALLILGTNNLPLLTERISYYQDKDAFLSMVRRLPNKIRYNRRVDEFTARRMRLASEASAVLNRLGTNAAPAIPKLTTIVQNGGFPAWEALLVLARFGDEGLAVIASAVNSRDRFVRERALQLLGYQPGSRVVRQAMTNALSNPDPTVRRIAERYVTNRFWYMQPDILPRTNE